MFFQECCETALSKVGAVVWYGGAVRWCGTVVRYGGAVVLRYGTVVRWYGTVVPHGGTMERYVVGYEVRYDGAVALSTVQCMWARWFWCCSKYIIWCCGELEVGHGGLVRQRSNDCEAVGCGGCGGFGHGGWIMLDHCNSTNID